jgi:hypothetical protein
MKLALLVFLGYCTVAAAAPAGQAEKFKFSPGALLRAELDKTIDANKAKVGDVVVVSLTDDLKLNGEVLAPKNSKILGHITQAGPRKGDSPSVLGIAFDKLMLKDGSDVAVNAIIQAIGFPDAATGSEYSLPLGAVPGQAGGPGGTMGQPEGYYGAKMPGASNAGSAVKLSPNARGVVGIAGASLSSGAAHDSLIVSPKHTVKIENGAQMILCVQ